MSNILVIYFIFLSLLYKVKLSKLLSDSEIILTIKGDGKQQILSNKGFQIKNNTSGKRQRYVYTTLPSEIFVNGKPINKIDYFVYNLTNEENEITIKFNKSLDNCNVMFGHLPNITKIQFINFDTSKVTNMAGMFY